MKHDQSRFDVVVVGGGHAGCEAAAVAARMGASVALVTMRADMVGAMSCNPAIGGLGKGHLVREVDAWDGLIARCADAAAIHYRMLNSSKGSAVHGPRVQADRSLYAAAVQEDLGRLLNLRIIEGEATSLLLAANTIIGLTVGDEELQCSALVLATGTFLRAKMFRGSDLKEGGRVGERAATPLGDQLQTLGLPLGRFKTGTPPRIDGRTIDWASLDRQGSDLSAWCMSPMTAGRKNPQLFCGVTRTNRATHAIITGGLATSPLTSGSINGLGPRYCPSIEDKVRRFGDRDGHQIFLEPEGLSSHLVYPNGISTSLDTETQLAFIRSIAGLEQATIVQPGYAVEYDHVDPRALGPDLQSLSIRGLFMSGQINGTTGYEEAAAQGLVAGINAARVASLSEPVLFDREDSYIGVMIDDLTLQGVTEPYRMLTARAENRLALRSDNASTRLTKFADSVGALSKSRTRWWNAKQSERARLMDALSKPGSAGCGETLWDWMRRPDLTSDDLQARCEVAATTSASVVAEVFLDGRYAPYVARQRAERRERATRDVAIQALDFAAVPGLSTEMIERLSIARPATLEMAGRIRGITPAALAALLVYAQKHAA